MTKLDAVKIINQSRNRKRKFIIHCEWAYRGMLTTDYIPNPNQVDEKPFANLSDALIFMKRFANATKGNEIPDLGIPVNIYPVYADNFAPVENYKSYLIKNR